MREVLQRAQKRVEQQLQHQLASLNIADERLAEAMTYGVMNGGKRLRPFLAYASAQALGGEWSQADHAAVALEMVHSYSLVHDDLPAMDNDDLRRGKPTCHIAFDEATAILAGDGLLTGAFEVLVSAPHQQDAQRIALVRVLSKASGGAGMVAGQNIDLGHVGKPMSLAELEVMHRHKTGALIRAAALMGAMSVQYPLSKEVESALTEYAEALGLAFQVWDDILDVEGDTATLGKQAGADQALNKPTYPTLLGLDGAHQKAKQLIAQAKQALERLPGNTDQLAQLADYVISRDH